LRLFVDAKRIAARPEPERWCKDLAVVPWHRLQGAFRGLSGSSAATRHCSAYADPALMEKSALDRKFALTSLRRSLPAWRRMPGGARRP